MKLALFTNMVSHHQLPLGQAFASILVDRFTMVCWDRMPAYREELGWSDEIEEKWLHRAWLSSEAMDQAVGILDSADVVIWGAGPITHIRRRVKSGRLTFRYAERLVKQRWRLLDPRFLLGLARTYRGLSDKAHHLLAVGPYCAREFAILNIFGSRVWRWGYFPEVTHTLVIRDPRRTPTILWAGRMIGWKRVDLLLRAAAWVLDHNTRDFRLRIIGCGVEEARLKSLAHRLGLQDVCRFEGPQSPALIGKAMEDADIYVLPSSRREGWGAVVNEAMSRGCCVVASSEAGSVPWLIQDKMNGRVFDGSRPEKLGHILKQCIDNPEERKRSGEAAYDTLRQLWSPGVAAKRFLELVEVVQSMGDPPFEDGGPCSPALGVQYG